MGNSCYPSVQCECPKNSKDDYVDHRLPKKDAMVHINRLQAAAPDRLVVRGNVDYNIMTYTKWATAKLRYADKCALQNCGDACVFRTRIAVSTERYSVYECRF